MKNSLKFGVLLGFMMILVSIIEYNMEPISIFYILQNFVIFLIVSGIIIFLAIKKFKEKNNGFASYGESLKIIFPILLTFILVWTIYNYIFHAIVFPDFFLDQKVEYVKWEKSVHLNYLNLFGITEFEYEEAIMKVEENIEAEFNTLNNQYVTFYGISYSLFERLFILLLLSLFFAVFYNSKQPSRINN